MVKLMIIKYQWISWFTKHILYIAWIQALTAMFVSLYMSERLLWQPCSLCWYQRILMYPLVLLIAIGIIRKDNNLPFYVLPFSILGALVALFHYLLQRGIIPETIGSCSFGTSCLTKYGEWFGFITTPLLSFFAFMVISFAMYLYLREKKIT